YVRGAATASLREGAPAARAMCLQRLLEQLAAPAEERNPVMTRRLLPVVATLSNPRTLDALKQALAHELPEIRAEASIALATWRDGAGAMSDEDVNALLEGALSKES